MCIYIFVCGFLKCSNLTRLTKYEQMTKKLKTLKNPFLAWLRIFLLIITHTHIYHNINAFIKSLMTWAKTFRCFSMQTCRFIFVVKSTAFWRLKIYILMKTNNNTHVHKTIKINMIQCIY